MAEIPVQKDVRRGGVPWWVWLIAALLVAGLLALLAHSCAGTASTTEAADAGADAASPGTAPDAAGTALVPTATATDGGGAVIAPTVVPTGALHSEGGVTELATGAQGAVISDANAYYNSRDKLALAGRRVEFANVRVTRVLSDRVFTVTSGTGELYALLDDGLNNGPMESRVVVRAGQLLDVSGRFDRVPDAETVDEQHRPVRLAPASAQAMHDQQIYLHVTTIRGSAVHPN